MDAASPFQTDAAAAMQAGLGNVPGAVTAAQQGISDAVAPGGASTTAAQGALDTAATGARTAAGGGQQALGTAAANIPGVVQMLLPVIRLQIRLLRKLRSRCRGHGRVDALGQQLATADAPREVLLALGQGALTQADTTQAR